MTGHIRRRGAESFELKFDIGTDPATGKRRVRYASFKGTMREAKLELARLVTEHAKGESVDPSKMTVAQYIERWHHDWASVNLSAKTLERYMELLRKHVAARIGDIPLQRLRPVDLNSLYADLSRDGRGEKSGLAPRTIGHVHRVLHRALGHAVQWALVHKNVAASVSPPRVEEAEIEILSAEQTGTVLRRLQASVLYPIAMTLLATGMRRGEVVALRWCDIDFEKAHIRIERTLEQTGAGLRFKSPKTKRSRRTISTPRAAMDVLRRHWKAQQEHRLALGIGKAPPDALVFSRWDGEPRHPDALTNMWKAAMKALGMPKVKLHALRHTHASQLIASGMDVLTISRRLGHANPTITLNTYGHLFSNTDDRAAEIMQTAFAVAALDP